LEALRAGERVSYVVHESRFTPYCQGLLRDMGASGEEVRRILFVTPSSLDRSVRGMKGRLVWDHTVEERGLLPHSVSESELLRRAQLSVKRAMEEFPHGSEEQIEKRAAQLVESWWEGPRPTAWERLLKGPLV
jgi:hypothetical protein